MTLQEAVKSGKLFKRPHEIAWNVSRAGNTLMLTNEDVLATDWVVRERKKEIGLSDLEQAFRDHYDRLFVDYKGIPPTAQDIARQLGLLD